jgi:hypothetical protein
VFQIPFCVKRGEVVMDRSTGQAIATASLVLAVGMSCALIVSGEWLIVVGGLGGWAVGMYLLYTIA